LTEDEQLHIEAILDIKREVPTLDNALGLLDPTRRTKGTPPRPLQISLFSSAAGACLLAIDKLIDENKETVIKLPGQEGEHEHLFGNLDYWSLPDPETHEPAEQDAARLVLREVWEGWFRDRPDNQKDKDGLELVRAWMWAETSPAEWKRMG